MRWSADIRDFMTGGVLPGDGGDHTSAWQAAFTELGPLGGEIEWKGGHCNLSAKIVSPTGFKCPSIAASGPQICGIYHPNAPAFKFQGGSGSFAKSLIRRMWFNGNPSFPAVEVQDQSGMTFQQSYFSSCAAALALTNFATGASTERVVLDDCELEATCAQAMVLAKTAAASDSFNNSGLKNRCVVRAQSGKPVFQIGAGCNAYLAPMEVMVWTQVPTTLIQNDSTEEALFRGFIDAEAISANPLTLGAGVGRIGLICALGGDGEYVKRGTAEVMPNFGAKYATGGMGTTTPMSRSMALAKGANVLCRVVNPSDIALTLKGSFYDFRYSIRALHQGFGGPGTAKVSLDYYSDQMAVGAPTITVDPSGNLTVTHPSWVGVTAQLDGETRGQGMSPRWDLN